ncbi:MAG: efflux RND transporter permease subunit [Planctomycetota bacterium]
MENERAESGLETLFFRNRHLLWLTVVMIFVGGLSASLTLPRLEDPRIVNRGTMIITNVPGVSAERVEALVTEVLEEGLDEIDAIKNVDSTSSAGVSVISVEFDDAIEASTNQAVFAEIRDKVGEVTPLLPPEAQEPTVDDKREAAAFTLIVGLTWDSAAPLQMGLLDRLADELGDRLRNLRGTELVRVYGEPEEEITVRMDRAELAELGMTPRDVAGRVAEADAKRPAGVLRGDRSDVPIEVDGAFETLDRVARVPLQSDAGGAVLTLGDVAEIERGWRTPEPEIALIGGRRSVLVAARVGPGVRVDAWAAEADAIVAEFEAGRGSGVRVDRVFEQAGYTTERLTELIANLLAGAGVIVVAVMVIMGVRSALIVATALPLVVAMVMFGWLMIGEAVHQMSIFGLIIALGLLIDNAIVMTDEVTARKARGASAVAAVGGSVRHLFLPLLASTITTVLAFAPIMLLPGSGGDFVGSIGTSVVLAIVGSFLVAMTLTAALAGLFTRPTGPGERRRWWRDGVSLGPVRGVYRRTLRWLYAMPVAGIAVAAALPLGGFAIAPTLGDQFFPPVDRNMFEVRVWLPGDTAIEATATRARELEATIHTFEGVERVDWLIGGSFPSVYYNLIMDQDGAAHYAHGIVTSRSAADTKRLVDALQHHLDDTQPDAQIVVRPFGQGPPVVADIEYRLLGPSIPVLQDLGDELRAALQAHPDVLHTQANITRGEPKLFFAADEDAARLAGMTLGDVADQLEGALEGVASGTVIEGLEQVPVRVRFDDAGRGDLDAVASSLLVQAGGDRWTSASALGELELRPELGAIARYNSERTNTIKAYTRSGSLPIDIGQGVLDGLRDEGFELPDGYRIELGGAAEQDSEATGNLAAYAPILVALMVATLILVFRSVRYAAVLGGVAVMALGLALLSTWSIGFPISFNTILGTLGLIGVALNDSIVVFAAILANPKARSGDLDAMVESVMGSTRHIIATTATTIGGFLPLLLFVGGDFWPSLAIVLVGGITGATLIALVYIPAAFLLVTRTGRQPEPAIEGAGPTPALA